MLNSLKSSEKQQAYAAAAGVVALVVTLISDTSVTTKEVADLAVAFADGGADVVETAKLQYQGVTEALKTGGIVAAIWRLLDYLKEYAALRTKWKVEVGPIR